MGENPESAVPPIRRPTGEFRQFPKCFLTGNREALEAGDTVMVAKHRRKNVRWEELDKENIDLRNLLRHFVLAKRTEGRSPKTISWYEENLYLFIRFLEESGRSTLLRDVGLQEVREFVLHMQQGWVKHERNPFVKNKTLPLSSHTILSRVRLLKVFFNWLQSEGYTQEPRLALLKPPKAQKSMVDVLDDRELQAILASLAENTALAVRNRAIVMTFLDTGIRCSELVGLTAANARIEDGHLRVLGKGNKERAVPVGANLQKVLLRYREHFRPDPATVAIENFFLSLDGYPLTATAIKSLLSRIGAKAGVPRLHAHLLRHTFATRYLINGGDVFSLQRILGHTTLAMVSNYVNFAAAHVAIQHRRHSPLDNLLLNSGRTQHAARNGALVHEVRRRAAGGRT